jgi:predicted CXXCH cytochrome family protein
MTQRGFSKGGASTNHEITGKAGFTGMEPEATKEVRAVRRLALLATGGALWLFLLAVPVFADGGPHVLTNNNGTAGLAGDCAACHRAHTAQAADLLKEELPGLCLSCHNGTGATADVVDGFQYVPDTDGTPTTTVLGALRGGGFSYALIGDPARLNYSSRGSISVSFDTPPAAGSITLSWPAFTGFGGGSLTFNATDSAATVQTSANTLFGTSTAYSGSGAANMSGLPTGDANVVVTKSTTTGAFSFAPHNEFRLVASGGDLSIPAPTVTADTTGENATVTNGISIGGDGHVAVLADGEATTSNHMAGNGVVWGNGPQGQGNAGATGVVLDCAKCHNPHGNGQYRILQTEPGEAWSGTTGVVDWTLAAQPVHVADAAPATLASGEVRNYTVRPSSNGLTTGVVGAASEGDYWRYKYDTSGTTNFTNFYLKSDPMNSGWAGTPASYATLTNDTGAMTAWCVQCHTRYNGHSIDGTSSLNAQQPPDAIFMFKHGTTRIGCEQCHVSHGSNRVMVPGTASADVAWPGEGFVPGTGNDDSRLLKVNNRGTCQLCHDPTGTVTAGTTVGTVPGSITPGP